MISSYDKLSARCIFSVKCFSIFCSYRRHSTKRLRSSVFSSIVFRDTAGKKKKNFANKTCKALVQVQTSGIDDPKMRSLGVLR